MQERFGLQHEDVLINFSHTHYSVFLTGEDTSRRLPGLYSIAQNGWSDRNDGLDYAEDVKLFRHILDIIVRLVDDCSRNMIEGELQVGSIQSDFAVSRRRPDGKGGVEWKPWKPYYEGEIDKELLVLKLTDSGGAVKGILYNYGCHPTGMMDYMKFSNDFVGHASSFLEAEFPGAFAMFLQGCGGELKPRMGADGDQFRPLSYEEITEAGQGLGREIADLLRVGEFRTVNCAFRTALLEPLLYTEQTSASFYEPMAHSEDSSPFYRGAARRTIAAIEDGSIQDRLPHYIALWHLDADTRLVAMEGEVSTEYSLLIKRLLKPCTTLTLGYTNGVCSYIPTRKMIAEEGYEAACNFFFNLRGNFVPEIEDIIVGQIVRGEQALSELCLLDPGVDPL
ncbi:hypothetical protein J2Z66_000440 [Paenibacillus eucommiae]|uniref:Neutral/alkaline non-lysosomal ceramidase N-terminal domain-containing protein n=1 Tax=Paenibacillus eucommiae TaxID=1355755 RepID=A0ABS4IMQ7_9BACL|nr:hypothetical protein [Paenibacillus eucommiae]